MGVGWGGVISATWRVTPKPTPVSNRRGAKPLCGAVHSSNSVYCVCVRALGGLLFEARPHGGMREPCLVCESCVARDTQLRFIYPDH